MAQEAVSGCFDPSPKAFHSLGTCQALGCGKLWNLGTVIQCLGASAVSAVDILEVYVIGHLIDAYLVANSAQTLPSPS
jgi:hypothetical protein